VGLERRIIGQEDVASLNVRGPYGSQESESARSANTLGSLVSSSCHASALSSEWYSTVLAARE
jgi:hypothetical protein